MELLQRIQIGPMRYWLVEGHTLHEGATIEVWFGNQWVLLRHVQGNLLSKDEKPLVFSPMGRPARLTLLGNQKSNERKS